MHSHSDGLLQRAWIATLAVLPVAIALAPLLWLVESRLIGFTYGKSYQPFELLGFTAALALAGTAAAVLRRRDVLTTAPALGFLAAAFVCLTLIVEYSARSYDYACYETAASLLNEGRNPYSVERGTRYVYPPLFVIVLAYAQQGATWIATLAGEGAPSDLASDILFFGYQSAQLVLAVSLYPLLYLVGRRVGLAPLAAAGVALALVLVDTPLARTFKHNQVNLFVLETSLLALLFPAQAALAGLALAAGTHVKLYPALLLVPLWWAGHRRVAAWWLAAMLLPLLAPAVRELWLLFLDVARDMPGGPYRDNSVRGLVFNIFTLSGAGSAAHTASRIVAVFVAGALGVMLLRRLRATSGQRLESAGAEWLAFSLIASPLAWEHHYVLALPLIVVSLARPGGLTSWPVLIASAAILLPPTFDVFPFSYHRLAGLACLLYFRLRPADPARRQA